jgi:biopolymer transport protein ExbB/TolQ
MTPSAAPRRFSPTLATFLIGVPLSAGILSLFHFGPLRETPFFRYVAYRVQMAEVTLFCCALGGLLVKLFRLHIEREACRTDILPRWDGKPIPVDQAANLLASVERQPGRIQGSYLGQRIRALLEFICQRRNVADIDDQMRALADTDAISQENSFSLIRLITWALPILGFLGTVLGITGAISGVTPEALEEGIGAVTNGLAEAFDSTAVALALTMITMFLTSLIEKQEQGLLETVDKYIDRHLAHRWQRDVYDQAPALALVQRGHEAMIASVESVVQKQAEVWSKALAEPERRAIALQERMLQQLLGGLQQAMEQTLQGHAQRLAALEQQSMQAHSQLFQQFAGLAAAVRDTAQQQQQSLTRVSESIAGQAAVLGKLQADEANLVHLQAVLHQNLAALASAGNFEEAVHSLTAAIHLLTSKASSLSAQHPHSPRIVHGKAA